MKKKAAAVAAAVLLSVLDFNQIIDSTASSGIGDPIDDLSGDVVFSVWPFTTGDPPRAVIPANTWFEAESFLIVSLRSVHKCLQTVEKIQGARLSQAAPAITARKFVFARM